jgi:hypothetical protein
MLFGDSSKKLLGEGKKKIISIINEAIDEL